MIKATGKSITGKDMLIIGLSHVNLDKFMKEPLNTFIHINGAEIGMPFDVMIFSGKTEADMAELISKGFTPETKVTVSERSKN